MDLFLLCKRQRVGFLVPPPLPLDWRLSALNESESSLLDGDSADPGLDKDESPSSDEFEEDEDEGEEGRNSTWTVTPSNNVNDSELTLKPDWTEIAEPEPVGGKGAAVAAADEGTTLLLLR